MTYKELTRVKISDECTYNLVHGTLLILRTHPGSSAILGFDQNITLDISESEKDMKDEDVNLLYTWGWQRFYYADIDKTYWVFQMEMVDTDLN